MKAALYMSRLARVYSVFSRGRRGKGGIKGGFGVVTGAFPGY